ncbi:MAG: ATP-binding cassette domain-containing protein [Acidobacteriota bacterium]|jgi:phosphate transport system ATP-binding protein
MPEPFETSPLPAVDPDAGAVPGPAAASAPAESILETRSLGVRAGRHAILRAVDLRVTRGEALCLLGPSGAGKSTLLKCLNRLVDLEAELTVEGEVLLHGEPIYRRSVDPNALRCRIGMLFQQPVLFPGSVYDNAAFGLKHALGVPRRERPDRVEHALVAVGLWDEVSGRLGTPARTLSVGQQQRLCLARALALEPEVLLMDEPTSALDPRSTRRIEDLVERLKGDHTIVMVTHDPSQAGRVADRIACVAPREGGAEVIACTTCDNLLEDPAVREVLGGGDGP